MSIVAASILAGGIIFGCVILGATVFKLARTLEGLSFITGEIVTVKRNNEETRQP
jgi:hypothetical protein